MTATTRMQFAAIFARAIVRHERFFTKENNTESNDVIMQVSHSQSMQPSKFYKTIA